MNQRVFNYILVLITLTTFVLSLLFIKYGKSDILDNLNSQKNTENIDKKNIVTNNKKENNSEKVKRFLLPVTAMFSFFAGCYFVSLLVIESDKNKGDKYVGIYFLFLIGIILFIMNATVLNHDNIHEYIKGKKFTYIGLIMAISVGATIFGFIDNFGLKLGTEALDNVFLYTFLRPFSKDTRFLKHRENIKENIETINTWAASDWRKVLNQVLRFRSEIDKHPEFYDLSNSIKKFKCKKLDIPKEILKNREMTNNYVDNLRSQYDIIDDSKAMMGNTFSNFIAAMLGAAILNLFIYMTGYDGNYTGDEDIDDNFIVSNISTIAPIFEGIFIVIGCFIPIFLSIAMKRNEFNYNNKYSWLFVGLIGFMIVIMMYFSVKGIKTMTSKDKKNSLKKTLKYIKKRLDLNDSNLEEKELSQKIDNLINSV